MTNKKSRLPFQDEDEDEDEGEGEEQTSKSSGVKLDASRSMFGQKNEQKKASAADLEEKVQEIQKKDREQAQRAYELSVNYRKLLDDKRLSQNKSPITEKLENDTVKGLTNMALELNNDDSKPEGIGSVGVITLLLRTFLMQRDRINELEYRIQTLEKEKSESRAKEK